MLRGTQQFELDGTATSVELRLQPWCAVELLPRLPEALRGCDYLIEILSGSDTSSANRWTARSVASWSGTSDNLRFVLTPGRCFDPVEVQINVQNTRDLQRFPILVP